MGMTIKNAKKIHQKSDIHTVTENAHGWYEVTSGTSGNVYMVSVHQTGMTESASCNCGWGTRGGTYSRYQSACSHVQAVFEYREHGRRTSAWSSEVDATRQHRPVKDIGDGIILTTRKVAPAKVASSCEGKTTEQLIKELGF